MAAAMVALPFCHHRNLAQYKDLWAFLETLARRIGSGNPILRKCAEKVSFMIDITVSSIAYPRYFSSESVPPYNTTPSPAREPELTPPTTSENDPAPPSYRDCNLEDRDWHPSITPLMRETEVAVHQQIRAELERPISSYPPQVQLRLQAWAELRDKVVSVIAIQGEYAHVYLNEMKSLLAHEIEMERMREMCSPRHPASHQGARGFQRSHQGARGFQRSHRRSPADANPNWRTPLPTFTTR